MPSTDHAALLLSLREQGWKELPSTEKPQAGFLWWAEEGGRVVVGRVVEPLGGSCRVSDFGAPGRVYVRIVSAVSAWLCSPT